MKFKNNCDYKVITAANDFTDDNISNNVATILPQNIMEEEELILIDSSVGGGGGVAVDSRPYTKLYCQP